MSKYALLCGSAPDGFTQKKINEMYDFLISQTGCSWKQKDIVIFPNGVNELMLSFICERLKTDKTEQIFLYICTLSPVTDEDKTVWLGGEKIRKSAIEKVLSDGNGQVIYDSDWELVREEHNVDELKLFSESVR